MNRLPTLFLGILAVFTAGWVGSVAAPFLQFGRLQQVKDAETDLLVPTAINGMALYGQRVYAANGCVYCHTQQVKGSGQGSDLQRGWGARRSVPRDYIHDRVALVGESRLGPDLANFGQRFGATNAVALYRFLYDPQAENPSSTQPPYRFLFKRRKIQGQRSHLALEFPGGVHDEPGTEIVPTYEAQALVSYLLALNHSYPLPEAPLGQ